jgi:superfamily II DNA/RNA helicase
LTKYFLVSVDGSVKFFDRTKIIDQFWISIEDGGPRLFATTDAAGEEVDLQIATVLINYDIP